MSTREITAKVKKIKELQIKADELSAQIESLKDEVKAEMTSQGVEELTAGAFKVSYKPVNQTRFDTAKFKSLHADIYEYDPDFMKLFIVGGGGRLIKNFGSYNSERVIFIDDLCASAKGFEKMAFLKMRNKK